MGTTIQKLEKVAQTKSDIKTAINNTGCPVITNSDTFASYADKINDYLVYPQGTELIKTNTTTDVTTKKYVETKVPPLIVSVSATVATDGTNTITFTGLPSEPRAWILDMGQSTSSTTWNNRYRCISARFDGAHYHTYTAYKGSQGSAIPYIYYVQDSRDFTATYNNGSLVITTNGTGGQTVCGPFMARTYVLMAICDNDGRSDIYIYNVDDNQIGD